MLYTENASAKVHALAGPAKLAVAHAMDLGKFGHTQPNDYPAQYSFNFEDGFGPQ